MKIGIVHYRAGRTDGVSLEIDKRREVLQEMGHEVVVVSGPVSLGSDYVIEQLEFDSPEVRDIKESAFSFFNRGSLDATGLMATIEQYAAQIEDVFSRIDESEQLDGLLLHNIFSHGRHIAAAAAFTRFLHRTHIPALATHHDYYWERPEYQSPSYTEIADFLRRFVPPDLPNLSHVSINSLAGDGLFQRKGIRSMVFGDVFDFDQPDWKIDDYSRGLPEDSGFLEDDLIILQATRIARQKGIEMAIDLSSELERNRKSLLGRTLYNGKLLTRSSRVMLVLAGYAEESAADYVETLRKHAESSGVRVLFIGDHIAGLRTAGGDKKYTLWDVYPYADLVTYPSLQEGWGNQFLEAVFARKPVVLFEFPVFKADIRTEGYRVISLGDHIDGERKDGLVYLNRKRMEAVAAEVREALLDPSTHQWLDDNYQIGRTRHGYHALRGFLHGWTGNLLPRERQT